MARVQRATRDERIAGEPPTYPSVRAALAAARAAVDEMSDHPGEYHYTHATGQYDLADWRTVEVRLRPASDGGVLLGVHEYAVWGARREHLRWRGL